MRFELLLRIYIFRGIILETSMSCLKYDEAKKPVGVLVVFAIELDFYQ
jgi:hypothetical protein